MTATERLRTTVTLLGIILAVSIANQRAHAVQLHSDKGAVEEMQTQKTVVSRVFDDCNGNGILDDDDILDGTSQDCNQNNIPDECDIVDGTEEDCNSNGIPDVCDLTQIVWNDITPPGVQGTRFGQAVAIENETIVVGSIYESAVYVYRLQRGSWVLRARLVPDMPSFLDFFGSAVAFSGQTIAVGARGENSSRGAVYVFRSDGNDTWSLQAKLTASDGALGDLFGFRVALEGRKLVVGAVGGFPGDDTQGAAYVFQYDDLHGWIEQNKLQASDGHPGDWFGYSVAISNEKIFVGAPRIQRGTENPIGAVYEFQHQAELGWIEQTKLTSNHAEFGTAMNISGNKLIIGAVPYSGSPGAVTVYNYVQDIGWHEQALLTPGDVQFRDYFGYSIAQAGDTIVIGAYGDDDLGELSGAAYIFHYESGLGWNQAAKLTMSGGTAHDGFGCSVGAEGNRILIGAYGASSAFVLTQPLADCNENSVPDQCDIDLGTSSDDFPEGGDGVPDACQTDCNGNGVPDASEIYDGHSFDCNSNLIPDECEPGGLADVIPLGGDGIPDACQDVLHVPGDFATIQAAVDVAEVGAFIALDPGVYSGSGNCNIRIEDKALSIVGVHGPDQTILDCEGADYGIELYHMAEGSLVQGLTIRNASRYAISVGLSESTQISNCVIHDNASSGIRISLSQCIVRDCLISSNTAHSGGGMSIGGGLVEVRNCTIVDNRSVTGGGIFLNGGLHRVTNTILWNNLADEGSQMALTSRTFRPGVGDPVEVHLQYNNIQAGESEVYFGSLEGIVLNWEESNLDVDPRFVMPSKLGSFLIPDYHLRPDSPCVNAGDPETQIVHNEVDIDGDPRLPDERIDIGADEFSRDCNGNGIPDSSDIAYGKSEDCNDNGVPDECDVLVPDGRMPISEDCNSNGVPDECERAPCVDCDLTGDGKIDSNDRAFFEDCFREPDPDLCRVADLDGDGKLGDEDRRLLQECFEYSF